MTGFCQGLGRLVSVAMPSLALAVVVSACSSSDATVVGSDDSSTVGGENPGATAAEDASRGPGDLSAESGLTEVDSAIEAPIDAGDPSRGDAAQADATVVDSCPTNCGGKTCGPDGCGGTCGACPASEKRNTASRGGCGARRAAPARGG